MRTDEVIEEVSVLCGQGVYDDRKKLLHCLSKAAREIGLGRPLPGRMKIRHYPPGTIYSIYGRITVLPGAPFSIGGSGVSAYCFEADGALKVRVLQDGELCESMEFSDADGRFVGKSTGTGGKDTQTMLIFETDSWAGVSNIALYPQTFTERIPALREYVGYDMRTLDDSFLSFYPEPLMKNGRTIRHSCGIYYTSGSEIYIKRGYVGEYEILYDRSRVKFDPSADTQDISENSLSLLTLLAAYYYCLDEDDVKAQEFLERYRECLECCGGSFDGKTSYVENVLSW